MNLLWFRDEEVPKNRQIVERRLNGYVCPQAFDVSYTTKRGHRARLEYEATYGLPANADLVWHARGLQQAVRDMTGNYKGEYA